MNHKTFTRIDQYGTLTETEVTVGTDLTWVAIFQEYLTSGNLRSLHLTTDEIEFVLQQLWEQNRGLFTKLLPKECLLKHGKAE